MSSRNIGLILSWALYDLANQFFAVNIISLYFPRWLTLEKNIPELYYSLSFGISMFLVAVLSPILGTISDIRKSYKQPLIYCTLISVVFTMLLGISTNISLTLLFFAIANFGCQQAGIFYNSLMPNICSKSKIGLISGVGKMFSYIGAILSLYFTKSIFETLGPQAVFFITGVLFLIFALPCMIFIKEEAPAQNLSLRFFFSGKYLQGKAGIKEVFQTLKSAIFNNRQYPGFLNLLKASFFGFCAVNIIILFMSTFITKIFGLTDKEIIDIVMFSSVFAIVGSVFSGFISDYIGYKRTMIAVFFLWIICLISGAFIGSNFFEFLGALVGVSLGSVWVVSRALVVKLVPQEKLGEVFGIFSLVGYISAVAGPLFWGLIMLFLSPLGKIGYRIGALSLIGFIIIAFVYLSRIKEVR